MEMTSTPSSHPWTQLVTLDNGEIRFRIRQDDFLDNAQLVTPMISLTSNQFMGLVTQLKALEMVLIEHSRSTLGNCFNQISEQACGVSEPHIDVMIEGDKKSKKTKYK